MRSTRRVTCAGCSSTAELPLPSLWFVAKLKSGERALCGSCPGSRLAASLMVGGRTVSP